MLCIVAVVAAVSFLGDRLDACSKERTAVSAAAGGPRPDRAAARWTPASREVITGTSLQIAEGEALGLVGESGSGKSMTAKAIARLLPDGASVTGTVTFDGTDVLALSGGDLRRHRAQVAVVFQDPRAHINPVRRISDFMTESLRILNDVPKAEAMRNGPRPRSRRSASTTPASGCASSRTSCPAACCSAS